ncbi:unnamed protein product, partial [Prorocentrum cordatum]
GGSSLAPSRPLAQPPVPAGPPNRCSWLHGVARARSSARPPSTMRRRARRGSAARRRCCSAGCGSRCRGRADCGAKSVTVTKKAAAAAPAGVATHRL